MSRSESTDPLEWLSLNQVRYEFAEIANEHKVVSRQSVYRWIRKGVGGRKLPAQKVAGNYKVRRCWLLDFIGSGDMAGEKPIAAQSPEDTSGHVLPMSRHRERSIGQVHARLDQMFARG